MTDQSDRSASVARSLLWSSVAAVSRQAAQFVTLVWITRLVTPRDVGLAAIALAVTAFGQVFTDLGLGAAVIQSNDVSDSFLATSFWINAGSGAVLCALTSVGGLLVARIYREPALFGLLSLASLTLLLSLGNVPMAVLEREMRFRPIAVIEAGSFVLGGAVGIVAAAAGLGATSLVLAPVATTVFGSFAFWIVAPLPRVRLWNWGDAREITRFVWGIVGFNSVNYWARNADNLIVGRVETATVLGYYARAYQVMLLPIYQVGAVVSRVLLPTLARKRDSTGALEAAWLWAIRLSWVIGLPLAVVACVGGTPLVMVLFGERWRSAGIFVSILALAIPAQLLSRTIGAVFQAIGKTALHFRVGLLGSASLVGLMLLGATRGARGVAVSVAAGLSLNAVIGLVATLKVIDVRARDLLRTLFPAALAAMAMATCVIPLRFALSEVAPFLLLVAEGLVGLVSYALMLRLLDPRGFRAAVTVITGRHAVRGRLVVEDLP